MPRNLFHAPCWLVAFHPPLLTAFWFFFEHPALFMLTCLQTYCYMYRCAHFNSRRRSQLVPWAGSSLRHQDSRLFGSRSVKTRALRNRQNARPSQPPKRVQALKKKTLPGCFWCLVMLTLMLLVVLFSTLNFWLGVCNLNVDGGLVCMQSIRSLPDSLHRGVRVQVGSQGRTPTHLSCRTVNLEGRGGGVA